MDPRGGAKITRRMTKFAFHLSTLALILSMYLLGSRAIEYTTHYEEIHLMSYGEVETFQRPI